MKQKVNKKFLTISHFHFLVSDLEPLLLSHLVLVTIKLFKNHLLIDFNVHITWKRVYFLDAVWCFLLVQHQGVDRVISLRVKTKL